MNARYYLIFSAILVSFLICCSAERKSDTEGPELSVSVPEVLPEQIEMEVMEQDDPHQSLENWNNFKNKVVRWSGKVVDPIEREKFMADGDFNFEGRALVVVKVRSLRVQLPSEKIFKTGVEMTFIARLTGYSGTGNKIWVSKEGLKIE